MRKTNSISTTWQRQLFIALIGVAVIVTLVLITTHFAQASLRGRVNEALRTGGGDVTAANSEAFQAGVVSGHYTSFAQLVGAVGFHKAGGTTPSFTTTSDGFASSVASTCVDGDVTSFSRQSLVLNYDLPDGRDTTSGLAITNGQYNAAVGKFVQRGSHVRVCSKDNLTSVTGSIINLAPVGQEDSFGNILN